MQTAVKYLKGKIKQSLIFALFLPAITQHDPFLDSFTNKNCTIVLAYFLVVTFLEI